MKCRVYKGNKKPNTYLFVDYKDNCDTVPEPLLLLLGKLEKVIDFELAADRRLAQSDSRMVIEQIQKHGYYLQLPPGDDGYVC